MRTVTHDEFSSGRFDNSKWFFSTNQPEHQTKTSAQQKTTFHLKLTLYPTIN